MSLRRVEIIGTCFGILLGSALHFAYGWSGAARSAALIAAVNESPWEHLKLYLFPVLLYALFEWRVVRDLRRLLFAKLVQEGAGMLLILAFFYTYTGALGIENVLVDILSFMVAMALGYWLSYRTLTASTRVLLPAAMSALALAAVVAFFWLATFAPPHLPLFLDPSTSQYGTG